MMSGKLAYCFALCAVLAGCVAEDYGRCRLPEPGTEEKLMVRITDLATGEDITDTGDVKDVVLMVFDEKGNYVTRIDVTAGQIGREIGLPSELLSTRAPGERLQVSAWGNLEENMTFLEGIGAGHTLSSQFLSLKINDEYTDNWYNPGDLFFGMNTMTLGQSRVHTIEIKQKTARMAVSVRGLPAGESADDYYFSMCEQNDGFTFDGIPLRTNEWCKIREKVVFDSDGEFATGEPYYVIPSSDPSDVSTCNAGVCLYKVGGGLTTRDNAATRALTSDQAGYVTEDGDLNITGKAKVDINGNHLALYPGQTTNVLITLTDTGSIEIRMKMTAWDEVYNWRTW